MICVRTSSSMFRCWILVVTLTLSTTAGFLLKQPTRLTVSSATTRIKSPFFFTSSGYQVKSPQEQNQHQHQRSSHSLTAMMLSPQEIIEAGVSFDTFAPQFLWLPMIAAPASPLTKKIMDGENGIACIVALALIHLVVVITAAVQEGALDQVLIFTEVFNPSLSQLSGMSKLFQYPNFVAEEWPHVLIWDLFVGRAIWLDGLQRGIDTRLALSFCNFIGPPGLLIHVVTSVLQGKGLPNMGQVSEEDEE